MSDEKCYGKRNKFVTKKWLENNDKIFMREILSEKAMFYCGRCGKKWMAYKYKQAPICKQCSYQHDVVIIAREIRY